MSNYEEAKAIAEKLANLEVVRKETVDEQKLLKEQLHTLILEGNIDSMFECQNGLVYLDTTTKYEIADGLKEEIEAKSKAPEKISDDFIQSYFNPDIKLNKIAKKAINDGDGDVLSVINPVEKTSIKIKLR